MGICICGTPIEPHTGKGRPGTYCSEKCRVQAFRHRSKSKEMDVTEIAGDVTKITPMPIASKQVAKPILKYPGPSGPVQRGFRPIFQPTRATWSHLLAVQPVFFYDGKPDLNRLIFLTKCPSSCPLHFSPCISIGSLCVAPLR